MHRIYYVLLTLIACLCGGGDGRGGLTNPKGSTAGRSSSGPPADRSYIVVVGCIVGAIGIACAIRIAFICYKSKQATKRDKERFYPKEVLQLTKKRHSSVQNLMNSAHLNVFRNGIWSSRCYQHGQWYGPFEFILSFDPETMQIKGWGYDNIGKFTISGNYSNEPVRMGILKTYEGDDEKDSVVMKIHLTGNVRNGTFEGKWKVQTGKLKEEDKFELKFVRYCEYYDDV